MYRIFILLGVFLVATTAYAAQPGTIDTTDKYAWSENLGWINFAPAMGNVVVSDTELTGYAWSETGGWITLHPSESTYVHNTVDGKLSGYAWGESTGYIDFNGVTIDTEGYFHGYARSDVTGRISFNCENTNTCAASDFKVRTQWHAESVVPDLPEVAQETSVSHFLKTGVGVVQETIASWLPSFVAPVVKEKPSPKNKVTAAVVQAPPSVIVWPPFPWILFGILIGVILFCLAWILFEYVRRQRRKHIPYSYRHTKPKKRKMRW